MERDVSHLEKLNENCIYIGGRDDGTGFGLEVTLDVNLPGMDKAAAEDLAARGHVVCPYSHSIKGNVNVKTNVSV